MFSLKKKPVAQIKYSQSIARNMGSHPNVDGSNSTFSLSTSHKHADSLLVSSLDGGMNIISTADTPETAQTDASARGRKRSNSAPKEFETDPDSVPDNLSVTKNDGHLDIHQKSEALLIDKSSKDDMSRTSTIGQLPPSSLTVAVEKSRGSQPNIRVYTRRASLKSEDVYGISIASLASSTNRSRLQPSSKASSMKSSNFSLNKDSKAAKKALESDHQKLVAQLEEIKYAKLIAKIPRVHSYDEDSLGSHLKD
jgi:hypothetical protein